MSRGYKKRVYDILKLADPEDPATKIVSFFLVTLIILNVIAVILETVESIYRVHKDFFQIFGGLSTIAFTIEYLLRI